MVLRAYLPHVRHISGTGVAFAGKATRSGCQVGPTPEDSQDAQEDERIRQFSA